jgi:hypothetical protein
MTTVPEPGRLRQEDHLSPGIKKTSLRNTARPFLKKKKKKIYLI